MNPSNVNISMWLNVIVAVLAGISTGAVSLTDVLSPATAHATVAWSTFLVAIIAAANAGAHGWLMGSNRALPKPPSAAAPGAISGGGSRPQGRA